MTSERGNLRSILRFSMSMRRIVLKGFHSRLQIEILEHCRACGLRLSRNYIELWNAPLALLDLLTRRVETPWENTCSEPTKSVQIRTVFRNIRLKKIDIKEHCGITAKKNLVASSIIKSFPARNPDQRDIHNTSTNRKSVQAQWKHCYKQATHFSKPGTQSHQATDVAWG